VKADKRTIDGRFAKAKQFSSVATFVEDLLDEGEDVADAYVTLCVHSGIASSDVICGIKLGEYSQTGNHEDAAVMLGKVDKNAANYLRNLLKLKNRAAYSAESISRDRVQTAQRAMDALLSVATSARER